MGVEAEQSNPLKNLFAVTLGVACLERSNLSNTGLEVIRMGAVDPQARSDSPEAPSDGDHQALDQLNTEARSPGQAVD